LYSRRLSEKTVKQFSEEFQGTLLNGIIEEVQPSKFTVYFPQQRFIGRIESPELQVVVLSEKVEGGENKNNAKEIRSVLESKVLNREVQIFVRGLSPEGLISGHVKAENFDSRKTLLTFGYAKLSKDALNILDVNEFKDLKAISHEAATKLRGLWRDQRENTNKTKSLEQNFVAKVVEIISGDSVKIINLETNESSRIYLSNIKAPVPGKPFAFEAKESLRKKTIGKKVKVEVEFSKNIPIKKDNGSTEDRNFVFASVFESGKNIGVQLLEEGFVALQLPRGDDEFTKYIDDLKNADEEAKKKKKGLHGESVRVPVFNDITSGREGRYKVDITKSKSIFSFLKDEKRLSGVVEVVLNGSRLKIRMHQQSCYIILVLEGIRCLPNEGDFKKWSQ
jgi:staphylococcal nuclease domain-containing protein 1